MTGVVALLAVVLLIVVNGLFVAAEFGLVAARRGLIEERADAGDRRARFALRELQRLSFVLSAAQFGITASSLLVGFLAEDAIGETLLRPVAEAFGLPASSVGAIAVTGAFLLSTVVQMLFGELAPKNYAIARPETVSLALGGFMRAFGTVFGPIIRVFDGAAEWVSRTVFRIEVRDELLGGHSLDELSRIVSASGQQGALTVVQAELLERAIDLGDTRVHELMVPRPDVQYLDADATVEDLRAAVRRTGHSRFPVRGANDDDIVGTVHVKDMLRVPADRRTSTPLRAVAAPVLTVPESEPVRRLLPLLRARQRTFAVVVDEYGGTAGIVTIEDLVEELVGEIEDEFDRDAAPVRRLGAGQLLLRGSVRADRMGDLIGVELPEGDYETVAGFVIDRLGRIPAVGEHVAHDGWRFTVRSLEGVRIAEVAVRRFGETP